MANHAAQVKDTRLVVSGGSLGKSPSPESAFLEATLYIPRLTYDPALRTEYDPGSPSAHSLARAEALYSACIVATSCRHDQGQRYPLKT